MSSHRRWTQTDITDLRDRARVAISCGSLADDVGRSPDDVARMMARLRVVLARMDVRPLTGVEPTS